MPSVNAKEKHKIQICSYSEYWIFIFFDIILIDFENLRWSVQFKCRYSNIAIIKLEKKSYWRRRTRDETPRVVIIYCCALKFLFVLHVWIYINLISYIFRIPFIADEVQNVFRVSDEFKNEIKFPVFRRLCDK